METWAMNSMIVNRKYSTTFRGIYLFLLCVSVIGCRKDWLDVNPNNKSVVLNASSSKLNDYQLLVQNGQLYSANLLGCLGSDDYYLTQDKLTSLSAQQLSYYLWAPTGYNAPGDGGWSANYQSIYICNTALSGLLKIPRTSENAPIWDNIQGAASFYRAYQYYQLAQFYMKTFDSASSDHDLGVPLRLQADVSEAKGRSSVSQVYNQIFQDLNQAKISLPTENQAFKTQPSKCYAYALLAQTYLLTANYKSSLNYADSALAINGGLLDFNTFVNNITPTSQIGVPSFLLNPEVFFCVNGANSLIGQSTPAFIDSNLVKSYDSNDLRKQLFFISTPDGTLFRGSYVGLAANYLFTAPAVDEMYLIKAECLARLGDAASAMDVLNALLENRWIAGTYSPMTSIDAVDALNKILIERRKELVMRGTRWTDLRRLNRDPKFMTTVTRVYNGNAVNLMPGSNLYEWPIPDDEILYSGIQQNPR